MLQRYETSFDPWVPDPEDKKGFVGASSEEGTVRKSSRTVSKANMKRDMSVCKFDVIITTDGVIRQDPEFFQSIPWRLLIVDEAHSLKNHKSALAEKVGGDVICPPHFYSAQQYLIVSFSTSSLARFSFLVCPTDLTFVPPPRFENINVTPHLNNSPYLTAFQLF